MNKIFISLCAGILLGVSPLFAVPAKPVLVRVAQPDGSVITVKTVGDEFYHYKSTSDGIPGSTLRRWFLSLCRVVCDRTGCCRQCGSPRFVDEDCFG